MIEALGLYLAIDSVLSVLVLGIAFWKRDLIRAILRGYLQVPTPCECHSETDDDLEEDEAHYA